MVMRLNFPVEVERHDDTMSSTVPIIVQLIYERGKWRAQCQNPPISTLTCDSMEEALVAAAKEANKEWLGQFAAT